MATWDREFLLGIGVLFAWCVVICLCAAPQLFREWLLRVFCCKQGRKEKEQIEKIKAAQERVRSASKSFLSTTVMAHPNQVVMHQAMGAFGAEPILEDSRECSLIPDSIQIDIPDDPYNPEC